MIIKINTHHSSREEVEELKEYLEDKCWDFKDDQKEEKEVLHVLGEDSINGIKLNDKIRDEELHEYSIVERDELIENLIMWISEARDSNKQMMKDDLGMLMKWEDDYILSSNSTNSYIRQSSPEFDQTCKELLELNEEIEE